VCLVVQSSPKYIMYYIGTLATQLCVLLLSPPQLDKATKYEIQALYYSGISAIHLCVLLLSPPPPGRRLLNMSVF
jgi:hypothetical protein